MDTDDHDALRLMLVIAAAHRARRLLAPLAPWYPQPWFSVASRAISAAISALTGGRPARRGYVHLRVTRRDTGHHHGPPLTRGASLQLTGRADFWHPTGRSCEVSPCVAQA